MELESPGGPDDAGIAKLRRLAEIVALPLVGTCVIVFGLGLGIRLPNRISVVGWNVAWAGFDIALGLVVVLTWVLSRRGSIWAFASAGALNAFQLIDIWFSLTVFYSVKERPGILVWAAVVQPLFAYLVWHFVIKRVHRGESTSDRNNGE